MDREKRDGKMTGGEEKQRGDRQKKLTRLVIRGGKDGKKNKKTWAQVPDFLCQRELRVTMATRQWSDVISSNGCLT